MDDLVVADEIGIHTKVVVEILYQFMKHSLINTGGVHGRLRILAIIQKMKKVFTLTNAFNFILSNSKFTTFLVNIDNVSVVSPDMLKSVLKLFGDLLCTGYPVYFTVTGVYQGYNIEEVPALLSMRRDLILLPPLTTEDSCRICRQLGVLSQNENEAINPLFLHLVWQAGGMPRYLAYLLYTIATASTVIMHNSKNGENWFSTADLTEITKFITNMTHQQYEQVLSAWAVMCNIHAKIDPIPMEVLDNLVSLCVSEAPVGRGIWTSLSESTTLNPPYTIETARQTGVAMFTPDNNLFIPPITLYHLYNTSQQQTGKSCFHIIQQNLNGISGSSDSESFYVSVILHRLRALVLLGRKHTRVSKLLAVPVQDEYDVLIDLAGSAGDQDSPLAIVADEYIIK